MLGFNAQCGARSIKASHDGQESENVEGTTLQTIAAIAWTVESRELKKFILSYHDVQASL